MTPIRRLPRAFIGGAVLTALLMVQSASGAEGDKRKPSNDLIAANTVERVATPVTPAVDAHLPAAPASASAPVAPGPDVSDLVPGALPDAAETKPAGKTVRQVLTQEFLEDVKEFQGEARDFQEDVRRVIRRKLSERTEEINKFYDEQVQTAETAERDERQSAIALFERFLQTYPNEKHYTPDAMIRLAELYYEQTKDEHDQKMAEYQDRLRQGATDEPAPEDTPSYQKSIALYQRILTQFPDYEYNHAVMYMLGWALNEQHEAEAALDIFRQLTEKFPKSQYVPEAWLRVGEYYFNNENESAANLQEAIKAYTKATEYKDSKLYDKALYKLAWTYYRLNDFDHAVPVFLSLVDYYDSKKSDVESSGDLREEALQYAAISFGDDSWANVNGSGSVDKLTKWLDARGGHSYDSELFKRLGKYLYDGSRYEESIAAFRIVLQRGPTAPDAPDTAERLIRAINQAYVADAKTHNEEEAIHEGDALAAMFSEASAWQVANKDDQEVLQKGRDLVERIRISNASYYFKMAAKLLAISEDQTKATEERADAEVRAKQYFKKAAESYEGYLHDFPRSKNVYSIQFNYAYSLYQSGEYMKAADIFTQVRDSNADNAHFQDAAYYTVAALQKEISEEEKQGKLTHVDPCIPVDACKAVTDFSPKPIADIRLRLISAADIYLKRAPKAEDGAQLTYIAGQTFYTYFHFDDARERYKAVVKRFPTTEFAQLANDEILMSYLLQKNWLAIEDFITDQIKTNPAVQKDKKKLAYLRNVKYTARFARGDEALKAQKWDEAAKLYESIVTESKADGGYWSRADECIMNQAFALRQARRFDAAANAYEQLYTTFPESKFAEEALFRVADARKGAFDFESAIKQYLMLVDRFTDAANKDDRKAALFNAAQLLEALHRYPEAAKQFQKYADLFPDAQDAPDMVYEAVILYSRMHDNKGLVAGLRKFIRQFGNTKDPAQAEKIVEAHRKIAKAYQEDKDEKGYKQELDECVKSFERLQLTAANTTAARAASECRFEQVEAEHDAFLKEKLDPRGKKLEKYIEDFKAQFQSVGKEQLRIKGEYTEIVTKYKWGDTAIASLYRLGDLEESIIDKLMKMPCPVQIADANKDKDMRQAACDEFLNTLRDQLTPQISDRSANAYQTCSDKSYELRIVNDWSKLCMEKVCQNTPSKCRSMKDPREELVQQLLSPKPPVADSDGQKFVDYGPPSGAPAPTPTATPDAKPATAPVPGIGAPNMIVPAPPATSPGMVVPVPNAPAPAPSPAPPTTDAMPAPTNAAPTVILPPSASAPAQPEASIPGGTP